MWKVSQRYVSKPCARSLWKKESHNWVYVNGLVDFSWHHINICNVIFLQKKQHEIDMDCHWDLEALRKAVGESRQKGVKARKKCAVTNWIYKASGAWCCNKLQSHPITLRLAMSRSVRDFLFESSLPNEMDAFQQISDYFRRCFIELIGEWICFYEQDFLWIRIASYDFIFFTL